MQLLLLFQIMSRNDVSIFLSTIGTSTGAPVCPRNFIEKSKNRFGDHYLTLRYFLQHVVSGSNVSGDLVFKPEQKSLLITMQKNKAENTKPKPVLPTQELTVWENKWH
jgi:hypothetical protein